MWDKYKFLIALKDIWAVGLLVGVASKGVMRHKEIINVASGYYVRLLYRDINARK